MLWTPLHEHLVREPVQVHLRLTPEDPWYASVTQRVSHDFWRKEARAEGGLIMPSGPEGEGHIERMTCTGCTIKGIYSDFNDCNS